MYIEQRGTTATSKPTIQIAIYLITQPDKEHTYYFAFFFFFFFFFFLSELLKMVNNSAGSLCSEEKV